MFEQASEPMPASSPLRAAKAHVRAEMLGRLKAIGPDERARRSEAASGTLVQLLATVPAGAPIAVFAPTPTELSCEPAIAALAARHPLLFPRVDGAGLRFQAATLASLRAHSSKVREPAPDAEELVPRAIVIPGRAFDRDGVRLGRGAGFYDRTLATLSQDVLLIGFVYVFQVVEQLPRGPSDRAVQLVVTDVGEPLRCRQAAALSASSPDDFSTSDTDGPAGAPAPGR